MGLVLRGRHRELGLVRALKVLDLPRDLFDVKTRVARFEREVQTLARVRHPNVVAVHEAGQEAGRLYFAMDLVEGRELEEVLAQGPLDFERARSVAVELANGVAALHAEGIVHRDLKPSNVVLDAEGRPVVLDLGLAVSPDAERLTRTGAFVGTPIYMAPEQFKGERSPRSDVYALGLIVFELFTGSCWQEGNSGPELVGKILSSCRPLPSSRNPELPRSLDRVVARACALDPAQRYADAAELAEALAAVQPGSSLPVAPLAGLTLLLVAVGLGIAATFGPSEESTTAPAPPDPPPEAQPDPPARPEPESAARRERLRAPRLTEPDLTHSLPTAGAIVVFAEGTRALTSHGVERVEVYSLDPLKLLKTYETGETGRRRLLFSHESEPGSAYYVDAARLTKIGSEGDVIRSVPVPQDSHRMAIAPVGFLVAFAGDYEGVHLLEVSSGIPLRSLEAPAGAVTALTFSADGERLISGLGRQHKAHQQPRTELSVWSASDGSRLATWDPGEAITILRAAPTGLCAVGTESGRLLLYDLNTFQPAGELTARQGAQTGYMDTDANRAHLFGIRGLAFAPDGSWLVSASHSDLRRSIACWDMNARVELERRPLQRHLLDLHGCGGALLANLNGRLEVWLPRSRR